MHDRTRWIATLGLSLLLLTLAGGCGTQRGGGEPGGGSRRPNQPPVNEHVAVDWLGRGHLYAARVIERRAWILGVQYADGEREWVEPSRIQPLPDLRNRPIQVYLGRSAQNARVVEQREELFHVELESSGDTWVSVDQLYALDPLAMPPPPDRTAVGQFPRRRPTDPSLLRPGARILAYYGVPGSPNLSRPYTAEITQVSGSQVHVRWLTDRSEGDIPLSFVLRIFEPVRELSIGDRVWIAGEPMAGVVRERRQDLARVVTEGTEEPGQWLDLASILGRVTPVPEELLREGALVTAMWNHRTAYHGTFVSMTDDQVTIAWHDGSTPSAVPRSDVVEVWAAIEGQPDGLPTPAPMPEEQPPERVQETEVPRPGP